MEYLNGTETGKHRLTTQSAIIGELTYFRKRDGKKISLYDDKESYGLSGCIWEQLTKVPNQKPLEHALIPPPP